MQQSSPAQHRENQGAGAGRPAQQVAISGEGVEIADTYKFLVVKLDNKLDSSRHRGPLQERTERDVLSEETRVLLSAATDVLAVCGGRCDDLCCGVLGSTDQVGEGGQLYCRDGTGWEGHTLPLALSSSTATLRTRVRSRARACRRRRRIALSGECVTLPREKI